MSEEPTLADRVARLEDERAVLRTLYAYAHGLDYGPEEEFLDVFAEGGVWERVDGRYGPRRFEGREQFEAWYRGHTHAPDYAHKHTIVNPVIDIDGDEARARFYLVYVNDDVDGPYVRAFSRCNDRLTRCADGRWRIASRRAELESVSPREYPPVPWAQR